MEPELGSTSVREQLIVAGIAELEAHGIPDFSLRRVATACNLSCAAPYKHFKDKDALIDAIFAYIRQQLDFLLKQVADVFEAEPRRQLVESCGGIDFSKPFCVAYSGLSDSMMNKYIIDSAELFRGHEKQVQTATIGCAIGTHAGPGAVAVAFYQN